jgi:hypothetical protein
MANFFDQFDEQPKSKNFFDQFDEKPVSPPVKEAGFSLGDIAKSFGMGATGSTKALTDVAGAGNVVSSKLEGATESLQRSLTPERQAEMERQAARMKAAEESGSILQEIKAGALNVAEAPLQSAAQAIGSFVPYLPALFAAPVAAAMRLTPAAVGAVRAVAQQAPKVIGTAQGAGAVKGSIYEGVLQAEIESGTGEEEAKQKASAAQDYFGKNFDQIALGAGLGRVAAGSGVEKFLTPAGRAGAAQGVGRRVGEAVVKESLPEAAQGGQERLAQNIGLQREGFDVDTFKGVAGAATQEALTGALGAAPIAALSRPDPTIAAKKEEDKFKQEEEEFRRQFGKAEPVEEPEAPTEFPGGYTATRRELSRQDVPESYGIFAKGSDSPLTTVSTQEEADKKLQTLTEIRQQEQERLMAEGDNLMKPIEKARRNLEVMEATGRANTDEYVQARALLTQQEQEADNKFAEIFASINNYAQPLTLAPVGSRTDVQSDYVVKRGDQEIGAFPTLQDAETRLREIEPETFKQVEQQARVKTDDRVQQLKQTLTPMLAKFGLQDVGLNVVEKIENDAGGSYLDRLINISLTEDNPIQTMRHEAMHALKDLQFFTPQQYKALEERANKEWIKTYLADVPTELNGVQMSRLDAYKQLGLTQEEIVEEAISDAFGAYDKGATPPPGMIAALFKKLKNFFANFGQALRGAGFESADDVFQRVERGELKSRKPKAEPKAEPKIEPKAKPEEPVKAKEPAEKEPAVQAKEEPAKETPEAKYSLAGEGVPMSTRRLMESQTPVAQQDIGLNTEAKRGRFNNVRDIAKALNQQTLDQIGAMDRNNLTQDESTRIAEAIADEVAYQLQTSSKTGTGLGWYSNNYPNAVKRLGKRFPELSTSKYARSVFSALVAVTSNGERVAKNIDNAIKLYGDLRKGKPLVAMGNRRATALENNLQVIEELMAKHGENFEKVLLQEITVKEMNARLREMGEKADGSYLANTVVPAAAVYFGPKLGAFYANLSGSEGYLTMDLWWTRSINRMRGLLIPKATEASISKFRDMMDAPDATRDEIAAATIPLRNKYEEYGWNSELEHLVAAKEPSTKDAKPAWFKKAEEVAGDAYEQLLFEHNLEKMANTIYKNEFEMLEEAPFTATDRKFMYDAARKAQALLRKENINLSLADIQAALWYYEKRLYEKLSGRKADDIGYEEAIIAQADQGSGRARPSVVFDKRADSGTKPEAKGADTDEVRGQPTEGAKFSLKNVGFPSVKATKEAVKNAGVPKTDEFKQFIAGNQWNDEDGEPMKFYHATAREFFEFTPAGQSQAIFLATTPEEAETFGSIAEDNLRKEIYEKLLNKDEKLNLFQQVVDAEVDKGSMTAKQGEQFMRQVNRKAPKYGDFGDIEQEVYDALLDLSPTRMSIMPLFARAETPFDFENQDHVEQVMQWVANNTEFPQDFPDKWLAGMKGRISQGLWQAIEDKRVQQALRALGFDAFTVREGRNSPKNYAVYKPEQVKSITGNLGDFSRESKNIKYSLPTIPQNLQDRMGETTSRRERKTVIQSIVDAIRPTSAADFRAKYLNRYNQMSVYDKKMAEQMGGAALLADQSAESAALMSDLGAGVAASAMGFDDRNGGIPVLRNGITTIDKSVKGLIASLAPLAEQGDPAIYQRYQYWAMVKRGQRLNKEGKLTGIDNADVAFARILEKAHPEFVSVQKDLVAFNNGLVKYMVDTGVLSKERGQIYTNHADYIPFYRQMDGDKTLGPNLFQSLSGVKPPKKLKGADAAEAPLADFLETMVRNTQSSIQAGIKNYAAQRALNVAVQVKAPGMGAERLNTKENGPNIINVLEKGNLVSYRTPDTLLVNAMMSLNQSELPFMGFLSAPADLLRNLVTKEPGFMMANMLRDSLSAWVTSGVKMTPIAGTVINFGKGLARKSPGFEAMLDAGIIGGYEFSENIEQSGFKLEKDLAAKAGKKDPILLRPFTSVWDALGKGTTASDAATRALIYERVLADTGNEAEALYRSLEVMNFHRKGSSPLIRVLTAAVPFFNARLQGLDLFYRASFRRMNNKDAAAIQRQFFMRGFTMMALSGLYWMMVSDDEEYKKQEQETKDNNWIIPAIGAKIPIPFEVGVLFKVIPERIMAYSFGSDTGEDLQKSMIRAAVSTFAFNPIPQTIKPVLEAYVDYNMFTMRPILGQGMKDIEPEFQVGPSTSNFATMLAQNLGLSPIKVDHIIKGYTGTIGMYAIDTIDIVLDQFGDSPKPTKRFEQLPVIKRFASDPEARGFVTQYYELKDAVDTTVRTMNLLERTGQYEEYAEYLTKNQGTLAFKDYVSDIEKTLKDLREMKTAIRSSSMDGDDKRDALLEISRMESAMTSGIQDVKKAIAQSQ